ncbi:MAG: protein kinase [Planctomycetaceae bacterium]
MQPPRLHIVTGPDKGRSLELVDGRSFVIGRGQDAEFRLDDPRVSRAHCRVSVDNRTVALTDNGSTGGTRVNGAVIKEHTLRPGDVIQIGESELRYQLSASHDASTLVDVGIGQPRPLPTAGALDQLIGKSFAHFELQSIVAPGKSGMVFKARDTKKNRPAAVKVLSPEFTANQEERERFVRGIKTMAPIKHENIVALYAAGTQEPYCWVAMEYVDGENLTQVIERIGVSGMLDWQHAFRVGVQIGRALEEAAKHKVIHRNVTPQNILIRSQDKVAKLGDLTLAKALEGTMVGQLTRPGELVGDLAYMSPERTGGMENVDGRSDIYGLGATLYAMLTGRPPLEAGSLPELISRIRYEEPAKPKTFQLSIPDMFQDVVLRMLSKRSEDRFQTPTDLLTDLHRVGKFQGVAIRLHFLKKHRTLPS